MRPRGGGPTPAQQRANDRTRPWIVAPVLATLLVYAWCYTRLAAWLGVATPADLARALGLPPGRVLDDDGNVDAKLRVPRTEIFAGDDERMIVFAAIFAGFLAAYFLPPRHRPRALVACFLAAFAALHGGAAAADLLAAHLTIYLLFHPAHPRGPWLAAAAAALACPGLPLVVLAPAAAAAHARLAPWLARGGAPVAALRLLATQACMLTILVAALGGGWTAPVGLVFFFYQWARLMVYHADFRDGEVPPDLALADYLAVFLSPAALFNMAHAPYLGQGYTYLRERWLVADKTALVRAGLRLWWLALAYMVLAEQATQWFIDAVRRAAGVEVHAFTGELVRAHLRGEPVSTPTVLLSTLVDQARIFLIYGGVTHFRVGAWRVLGWAVDPQYDRPWLATNLAALWGRFAFHFREFLVRVFYYPVFFTCFRRRPVLRIFAATMFATVVGNLVWGHVPPATITSMRGSTLATILSTWPYFVLLGLGISLTQVWLLRRPRTRRPWTRDRWFVLDLVCGYLTLQYFALIHIYIRPQPGGSLRASTALVLRGLGLG
jgi:hypothetical protein